MHRFAILIAAMALLAGAQAPNNNGLATRSDQNEGKGITIPAGTTVLLHLRSPINTKNARAGDAVYCETAFPVTQDNVMIIPSHTYVKGQIMRVQRPGKVKGRAELQLHFNTLIFPDGYTVQLPGSLQNTPGSENHGMEGQEGTVKANGQKGKDAGTIATTAGTGAAIGAVVDRSVSGAGIGAGAGAAVGLAKVLLTRGQEIRLETGTALEMVLERPLTVDASHAGSSHARNDE